MSATTIDSDAITVTQAAARPAGAELQPGERDYAGPDGVRSATLLRVSDIVTQPSTLPKAKPGDTYSWRTWTFAIDDGSEWDGQILQRRASVTSSNSEKSTQYEIISALAGKTVPVGASLSIRQHLVLRNCLIRIVTENEYPRIAQFMALPANMRPAAPAPAPVATQHPGVPDGQANPDGLPF